MDDDGFFVPLEEAPDDADREAAIDAIVALRQGWKSGATKQFGTTRWQPDLEASAKRVLLLSLTPDIPGSLLRRAAVAVEYGYGLSVALGSRLVDAETLLGIQALDARVIEITENRAGVSATPYRSVADWIASAHIVLSPDDFALLARARLDAALATPNNVKGRYFEETLCLVFAQVPWLTVDEHAYHNASEEIDLVLGVHATGHVAALAGGAIAVATAKNEAAPTDSATVKYLKEQMANRKGRCSLGFLCSATTISRKAKLEILRGSQSGGWVIAEIDCETLRGLLAQPESLDQRIQEVIRQAIVA